jgi:hypothetical protein
VSMSGRSSPSQPAQAAAVPAGTTSRLSWAFNNPELSDMTIVITTATPSEYRACMYKDSCHRRPGLQSGASAATSPHSALHAAEEIYAHKLVLGSYSEFFKAAVRWDGGDGSGISTNKRRREADEVVIVSLPNVERFGTAKLMIRFMYTHALDGEVSRMELIHAIALADEYSVEDLRTACLQRLAGHPLHKWSAEEVGAFCSIARVAHGDASAPGALGAAAAALFRGLASDLAPLEEAWQSAAMRTLFSNLPADVVLQVLADRQLAVTPENTVLVAVLSWLRAGGADAAVADRQQVVGEVRLLLLSPWFLSWVLVKLPEVLALLPGSAAARVVRYLATSPRGRERLRDGDELLRRWSVPRAEAPAGRPRTAAMRCHADSAVVHEAVRSCFRPGPAGTHRLVRLCKHGCHFHGFDWQLWVRIRKKDEPDCVSLAVGVVADLVVNGEHVRLDAVDAGKVSVDATITIGTGWVLHLDAEAKLELGQPHYSSAIAVKRASDTDDELRPFIADGQLTVECVLRAC